MYGTCMPFTDAEVQQLDVDDTPSLYQKLSLRELKELSQFIATPECDLTALGYAKRTGRVCTNLCVPVSNPFDHACPCVP